eukprot:TRINITY_DN14293_c0_g1_i3.p1 TRINITY_DN14293_c0_g1~~TRINITY_DN14293_c0_g1_i3.p1  ORF type:complete len:252 (-),score=19.82 TRINITY_DN14293_c0_g1_i3:146-901(-)
MHKQNAVFKNALNNCLTIREPSVITLYREQPSFIIRGKQDPVMHRYNNSQRQSRLYYHNKALLRRANIGSKIASNTKNAGKKEIKVVKQRDVKPSIARELGVQTDFDDSHLKAPCIFRAEGISNDTNVELMREKRVKSSLVASKRLKEVLMNRSAIERRNQVPAKVLEYEQSLLNRSQESVLINSRMNIFVEVSLAKKKCEQLGSKPTHRLTPESKEPMSDLDNKNNAVTDAATCRPRKFSLVYSRRHLYK